MKRSYDSYREEYFSANQKFVRRTEEAKLLGVCAGLAHKFSIKLLPLRIVVTVLAIFFPWPAIVAYIVTGLLTERV